MYFFCWPLCCLLFFDLRILIPLWYLQPHRSSLWHWRYSVFICFIYGRYGNLCHLTIWVTRRRLSYKKKEIIALYESVLLVFWFSVFCLSSFCVLSPMLHWLWIVLYWLAVRFSITFICQLIFLWWKRRSISNLVHTTAFLEYLVSGMPKRLKGLFEKEFKRLKQQAEIGKGYRYLKRRLTLVLIHCIKLSNCKFQINHVSAEVMTAGRMLPLYSTSRGIDSVLLNKAYIYIYLNMFLE